MRKKNVKSKSVLKLNTNIFRTAKFDDNFHAIEFFIAHRTTLNK